MFTSLVLLQGTIPYASYIHEFRCIKKASHSFLEAKPKSFNTLQDESPILVYLGLNGTCTMKFEQYLSLNSFFYKHQQSL